MEKGIEYTSAIKKRQRVINRLEKENEELKNKNRLLLEALKKTRSLNLHLYEENTVGNRVFKIIEEAISKA